MKSNNWKNIAEIIGIAALVASLLFIGMQMKQDRRLARAEAFVEMASSHIELAQLMIENHSAWIRGLDGEKLSKEEQAMFDQVARTWYLLRTANFYAAEGAQWDDRASKWRPKLVAYDFYKHPGLRQWLEMFGADFAIRRVNSAREIERTSFTDLVIIELAKFDEEAPPIPDDKTYMLP